MSVRRVVAACSGDNYVPVNYVGGVWPSERASESVGDTHYPKYILYYLIYLHTYLGTLKTLFRVRFKYLHMVVNFASEVERFEPAVLGRV